MIRTDSFLNKIENLLKNNLPESMAHQAMDPMPQGLRKWNHEDAEPRQSAVLILLLKEKSQWCFPLIQRPKYDGVHSGQIALPGGKIEETDQDLIATALRETEEEIGVPREKINVMGSLSEIYIPPSNFNILPIVGFVETRHDYQKDEKEVEELFEVSVNQLMDVNLRQEREIGVGGNMKMNVPCFLFGDKLVWGATAMILSEFSMILDKTKYE